MLTPATTASSVSLPALINSIALAQQLTPPSKRLALEITTARGPGFAGTMPASGSAAAPSITDLRLHLVLPISAFSSRSVPREPPRRARPLRRIYIMAQPERDGVLRFRTGVPILLN